MVKSKRVEFNQICRDIKDIKIQGARNIAKKALYAYRLIPTAASMRKLKSLRPTEPMLMNVLHRAETESYDDIFAVFPASFLFKSFSI